MGIAVTRTSLARLAGSMWCVGALILLGRSVGLWNAARDVEHHSAMALWLAIGLGIAIGAAKGRFVLSRTARRNLARIGGLPEPARPWHAFPWAFYPLIAAMVGMGVGIRMLARHGLPGGHVTALGVYIAIAAALIGSSLPYWRYR
jgi:hypothetical protein